MFRQTAFPVRHTIWQEHKITDFKCTSFRSPSSNCQLACTSIHSMLTQTSRPQIITIDRYTQPSKHFLKFSAVASRNDFSLYKAEFKSTVITKDTTINPNLHRRHKRAGNKATTLYFHNQANIRLKLIFHSLHKAKATSVINGVY
jgi:hypothetical protein